MGCNEDSKTEYELLMESYKMLQHELDIAKGLLLHISRHVGVTLSKAATREQGNVAKAIGCTVEELRKFSMPLVLQLVGEQYGEK